ncbi:hypothetical protein [Streptomyces phaeochromogenes]|uniref:hypothetical protein n=1 Tax=Streptomyces phaeochromogenes TaxID=1923 RepID=UPI0037166678
MSQEIDIVLAIQPEDREELESFLQRLDEGISPVESRSLDGATLVTALVTVTVTVIPPLKDWLISLVERRKGFLITFEGATLQGYSADEAERIISLLRAQVDDDSEGTGEIQ